MKLLKSSSALKADAREILLGKYKTAIYAYVLTELIITSIPTLLKLQVNTQTPTGLLLYYLAYFIVSLLASVIITGHDYMYLNMCRGREFGLNNLWVAFRSCADKAILSSLIIYVKSLLYAVPCAIAFLIMLATANYYFALLVGAGAVFMIVGITCVRIDYSQVFYLLTDRPELSARELLSESKSMMHGHRGSYFYLMVSFIGIYLLSVLTLGIGMLWIYPYITATKTGYYLELTRN